MVYGLNLGFMVYMPYIWDYNRIWYVAPVMVHLVHFSGAKYLTWVGASSWMARSRRDLEGSVCSLIRTPARLVRKLASLRSRSTSGTFTALSGSCACKPLEAK